MAGALLEAGAHERALLRNLGVSRLRELEEDRRVPVRRWFAAVDAAVSGPGPAVVADAVRTVRVEALEMLGFAIATSLRIRDALTVLQSFVAWWDGSIELELVQAGGGMQFRVSPVAYAPGWELAITLSALCLLRVMRLAADAWSPSEAFVPLGREVGPERCARVLGIVPRFDAAGFEVRLPPETVEANMRLGDAALHDWFRERLREACEREVPISLLHQCRAAVRRSVGEGPELHTVARAMAVSSRTLQRRLAEEGWSFRRLVDDERRRLAEECLANPTLSISEVAIAVGFEQTPSFYRACERWFGAPPTLVRRRVD